MAIKKFVFGTDSHGDMIDKNTRKAFLEFVDDYKPHIKIHGGDVFDFRPLRNGSGPEEKSESMYKDLAAGLSFIEEYQPTNILLGNHDDRLWKKAACWTDGILRDLCENILLEVEGNRMWKNAKVLPYDSRLGVLKIGDLQFIHGYNSGIYAARTAIQCYKGTGTGVIMGHIHRFSSHEEPSLARAMGISCGCLCQTDMPYNSKHLAKLGHANGWLFGEIHERKGTSPWEAWAVRKEGTTWLNPLN